MVEHDRNCAAKFGGSCRCAAPPSDDWAGMPSTGWWVDAKGEAEFFAGAWATGERAERSARRRGPWKPLVVKSIPFEDWLRYHDQEVLEPAVRIARKRLIKQLRTATGRREAQ